MPKAMLVNIDLKVRVIVPDDATEEDIRYMAALKALDEANSSNGISWLNEGAAEIFPDTEVPFDPEKEKLDKVW